MIFAIISQVCVILSVYIPKLVYKCVPDLLSEDCRHEDDHVAMAASHLASSVSRYMNTVTQRKFYFNWCMCMETIHETSVNRVFATLFST